MTCVILPGSYDPVTLGHLELIKKASALYEKVYAVIFINPAKKYEFSPKERLEMLALATEELDNVTVDYYEGYVIDYMREHGVEKIIKGYRNEADLEYEKKQAEYNLKFGGYETEFWHSSDVMKDISSTKARELIREGESLTEILPKKVISYINNR